MNINKSLLLKITLMVAILYAVFTSYIWFSLAIGASFSDLLSSLWVSIFVAVIIIVYILFSPSAKASQNKLIQKHAPPILFTHSKTHITALALFVAVLGITLLGMDATFYVTWAIFAIGATLLYFTKIKEPCDDVSSHNLSEKPTIIEQVVLLGIGIILIVLYRMSTTVNADDTHFVSYILGLIQHPEAPLFTVEKIFNNGGNNLIFALNYGESIGALTAVISTLTGIDHLSVYYEYVPIAFLLLVPVPLYYFTKLYFPKYALFSTLFSLVILIIWSTYNHLHGYFFIPRFFQGKALLLSFFLPLLFLIGREFIRSPSIKSGLFVCLLLIASGGSSSTGLYISVIVIGLCFLIYTPWSWKHAGLRAILLLVVIIPNLSMIATVKMNMTAQAQHQLTQLKASADRGIQENVAFDRQIKVENDQRPIRSMYWLFGDNKYLFIILLLIISTMLLVPFTNLAGDRLNEVRRLYFVIVIVALNHPLSALINDTIGPGNIIWRFHWAIPLSLIFTLFAATVLNLSPEKIKCFVGKSPYLDWLPKMLPQIAIVSLLLVSLLVTALGYNHLTNKYSLAADAIKRPAEALALAKRLVKTEKDGDVILAVDEIAEILPMLPRTSQLITSRQLYWHQSYFSEQETRVRVRLQFLINNPDDWKTGDVGFFKEAIDFLNVTTVVFKQNAELLSQLSDVKCDKSIQQWVICKY